MGGRSGEYQSGERQKLLVGIRAGGKRGYVQCPRCAAHFYPPLIVPATGEFEVYCTVCATGTIVRASEVRDEVT
jgi:hypothetical protein